MSAWVREYVRESEPGNGETQAMTNVDHTIKLSRHTPNRAAQSSPPLSLPDLVEIEDDVELADIAEEFFKELHEEVDGLEVGKLVVRHVHTQGKVQARVTPVNKLVVLVLHKVGVFAVPAHNQLVHFGLQTELLRLCGRGHIPLGQSRLALPILQQQEADLEECVEGRV